MKSNRLPVTGQQGEMRRTKSVDWREVTRYIVLSFFATLLLLPILWVVLNAFKAQREFYSLNFFPQTLQWMNFPEAWQEGLFGQAYLNSIFITVVSVSLGLLISSLLAFSIARLRFRGSTVVFYIFIASMMFPPEVSLVPLFVILRDLNLLDTLWSLIITYVNVSVPVSLFLLRGFFKALPLELDEAARVDGASHFKIYWRIILPLSRPALATVAVIQALSMWNEFLYPLAFISSPDLLPVPLAIFRVQGQFARDYPLLMAATIISSVPIVVFFLFMQRHLIRGIVGGALK